MLIKVDFRPTLKDVLTLPVVGYSMFDQVYILRKPDGYLFTVDETEELLSAASDLMLNATGDRLSARFADQSGEVENLCFDVRTEEVDDYISPLLFRVGAS
jgi:hypothetical protein